MNYMEEDKAVRNFIIIFVIVILFVVGIYFMTKFFNKDSESSTNNNDTNTSEVSIDSSVAIVGTMLNKSDEDYYVILYKEDDNNSGTYSNIVSKYKSKKDSLPIYTVDLSNKLNEKYYDKDNINLTATDINDLRFGNITLLEVKNGKIIKTYTNVDKIKSVLQ